MILPFHPLTTFLGVALRSGGVSPVCLPNLVGWTLRLAIQEPVRLAELAFHGRRVRRQPLRPDPVFILGHFRSGTTYLQELLAADPGMGFLNLYQMFFPGVFLTTEAALKKVLNRFVAWLNYRNIVHGTVLDFDSAGEEDIALTMTGAREAAYWGTLFPARHGEYFRRYVQFRGQGEGPNGPEPVAGAVPDAAGRPAGDEQTFASWQRQYLHLLRKVALAAGGRRLVLKSPLHTGRIPRLLQMFPHARFVYIHRNPYDVYSSSKRLWRINRRYGFQRISDDVAAEIILSTYVRLVGAYLDDRRLIPAGQLTEVRYESLEAAPLREVERIYRELDLAGFDSARPSIDGVAAAKARARVHREHRLEGREIDAVRSRWGFALERWFYPAPGPAAPPPAAPDG